MRDINSPVNRSRQPRYREYPRPLSTRTTRSVATRSTYFDIKSQAVRTVERVETVTVQPEPYQPVRELPVDQKVGAMTRALEKARKDLDKEHRRKTLFKRVSLVLVVAVILLSTGYVGFDTWTTNNRLKVGAESGLVGRSDVATGADVAQAEEGTDETKPPVSALDSYAVSPSLPRALYINKIKVASRVLPMSVNTDGSLQAPKNIFDAGWYTSSAKPGEDGAMLVDGHASGKTRQGLFGYLDTLVVGDQIQIEKGDGTRLTYKVVHTETVPLKDVDMKKMLSPYGDAKKALNLMTCTGNWIQSEKTYDQRALVWTEQV